MDTYCSVGGLKVRFCSRMCMTCVCLDRQRLGAQLHHRDNNTDLIYYATCCTESKGTQVAFFPRPRPVLQLSVAPPTSTHAGRAHTQPAPAAAPFSPQNKVAERPEWKFTHRAAGRLFSLPAFFTLSCEVSLRRAPRSLPLSYYLSTCSPSQNHTVWHKWRIEHSAGARIYGEDGAHLLQDK